jgi:hypothetical protein
MLNDDRRESQVARPTSGEMKMRERAIFKEVVGKNNWEIFENYFKVFFFNFYFLNCS